MPRNPAATSAPLRWSPACSAIRRARASKRRGHQPRVQRLVPARPEHPGEVAGLDPAQHDVGVGHGERAAAAVARGSRVRARRVRADPVPAAVESQDRAAAGRDRVDAQHRRAQPDPGHLGLVLPLELTGVVRDVGRGAAHVEADDPAEAGRGGGAGHADDAARRAGQDGVLAAEAVRVGQPAVGLHEQHPGAAQLAGHVVNVAGQDRGQVRVHDRGVPPGYQLHQRAGRVRLRDLGEPDVPGDLADPGLVRGITVAVHADHGHGAQPVGVGGPQVPGGRLLVQRHDHLAVRADPLGHLDHPAVQQLREDDLAGEDARPVLVADPQRVAEPPGDDQDRGLTPALEQRVGGHRGAEPDRADPLGRDGLPVRDPEQPADPGQHRVLVPARVLREQLADGQAAIRAPRDHVGERAAPVDPELPVPGHHLAS